MNRKQVKRIKQRPADNSKFLSSPTYHGDDNIPTSIELVQYNNNVARSKDISSASNIKQYIDPEFINWFKIVGVSDVDRISKICTEFGLHSFDIRDLLSTQQVTKVVTYKDITFVVMHGFSLRSDDTLDDILIAFILGNNFIISIQENVISQFDAAKDLILENNIQLREKESDYLLYILMTAVNTMVSHTIIKIEDLLSDIEDRLIARDNKLDFMHNLRLRRLDYTSMKRAVLAMREELPNLLHNTNNLIRERDIVYFNNYDDKLRATLSNLEGLHDSINSLLEIYYNNNNLKMNNIMQRLTIVSTIFIPLTFMAGVWGMNFKYMPELELRYGYHYAWIIFIIIVLIAFFLFKKKKWF